MRDTKRMFADELEAMMAHTALSRIRVKDLCERLGVKRRVFYYHFKDKYDLVAWMFEDDYLRAAEVGAPYTEELYAAAHLRLWTRRDFYQRAFKEDSQNSIGRYLLSFSIEANEHALKRYLGVRTLSQKDAFEARHFAHGNIGCLIEWLKREICATHEELAQFMFSCMPKTLRAAYEAQASQGKRD